MKRIYLILMVLAILLSAGMFLFEEPDNASEISPENLLLAFSDDSHYWSTDLVADKIIKQDPALLLIDVRNPDEYLDFSLPGALNIPLENILDPEWEDYFSAEDYDIVFFSNDEIYADQAWILLQRQDFKNLRVMKGGLNHWAVTILQPPIPKQSDPEEAFALYSFRMAARQYFGGGSIDAAPASQPEKIEITRKKKSTAAEGGC
ncbi:MAG: rhodanese-like domain-containing protein [Bacteroidetes bacterium]|nr:rhodanese-like domain-containing protein [Bacteroidota bacterium]